mmetsp:Transcript_13687/g.30210  ORF Transcript_13687/g.30210 Transcript_13687/m.30210 type:complete len:173 (-) Transcript_13687:260-778(-)|eukprot:CAMPEP_0113299202 /NCGR_PEP_ID=MMETSP0010_2-20120614/1332_1 /TAXON_ID=216773 ORGANISM="Corethron hystrix, Strain 308" /NCGR_SAMPLE_ID=MMETSP0010_2 /ASSEMBLY_ACC=CAM_ASM_000155 /LENGTH=172 /DNA_ID=CAMNT_0000152391 /DNA_START=50 /DNA_END=568 /DNA_ORIENTATION=+ /assembly_acc=CAM_ASM_000155
MCLTSRNEKSPGIPFESENNRFNTDAEISVETVFHSFHFQPTTAPRFDLHNLFSSVNRTARRDYVNGNIGDTNRGLFVEDDVFAPILTPFSLEVSSRSFLDSITELIPERTDSPEDTQGGALNWARPFTPNKAAAVAVNKHDSYNIPIAPDFENRYYSTVLVKMPRRGADVC